MADRNQLLNDQEAAIRAGFTSLQAGIWTAMPGIVVDVDFTTATLSVQPAIQGSYTDESGNTQFVNLPKLINVPIVFPTAGGFALTLPVKKDDEVLIVWACRCIDAWWQSGGIQRQVEERMHDLSDGFALIGITSTQNVLPSVSTTSAQLRTKDGTKYIELTSGGINMVGNVHITGNLVASGEVTAGSIPLTAHLHTGVTSGGSNTGAPIP